MARQFRVDIAGAMGEEIIEADTFALEGEMTVFLADPMGKGDTKTKVAAFKTTLIKSIRTAPRKGTGS